VAAAVAARFGVSKSELLAPDAPDMAVRLALGETHVIADTKKALADAGVGARLWVSRSLFKSLLGCKGDARHRRHQEGAGRRRGGGPPVGFKEPLQTPVGL
jgi:hypothetical protein